MLAFELENGVVIVGILVVDQQGARRPVRDRIAERHVALDLSPVSHQAEEQEGCEAHSNRDF
jgi:hypothetical protein